MSCFGAQVSSIDMLFTREKATNKLHAFFFPSGELLKALNHSISQLSILYTHHVLGKPINILEGFKWY